ncbi:MAG: hypothetical protein U5J96_14775 [Ignavibacteriaceae bacterium]|nr:hypothetical protein [Ignavibacteriaceae bacterium]
MVNNDLEKMKKKCRRRSKIMKTERYRKEEKERTKKEKQEKTNQRKVN